MKNNIGLLIIIMILVFTIGCEKTSNAQSNNSNISTSNSTIVLTDQDIMELFSKARNMVGSEAHFKWGSDGILYEVNTHETIEEYIKKYQTLFTDKYVDNYFDLSGYKTENANGELILVMNIPKWDTEWYDNSAYFLHFKDITDNSNYNGYDEIIIGGYGDKGSDMSFVSNKIEIIEKNDDNIIIKNIIQHNHVDNNPEYVCHIENGHVIIDGTYDGYDDEKKMPTIKDSNLKGTILSPKDKTQYWLETSYEYILILENGKWKFDNFVLWN